MKCDSSHHTVLKKTTLSITFALITKAFFNLLIFFWKNKADKLRIYCNLVSWIGVTGKTWKQDVNWNMVACKAQNTIPRVVTYILWQHLLNCFACCCFVCCLPPVQGRSNQKAHVQVALCNLYHYDQDVSGRTRSQCYILKGYVMRCAICMRKSFTSVWCCPRCLWCNWAFVFKKLIQVTKQTPIDDMQSVSWQKIKIYNHSHPKSALFKSKTTIIVS